MRIWISGGGTAGHVFPALAVAEAAGAEMSDALWLGTPSGMEGDIVRRHGMSFCAVDAAPIVGVPAAKLALNAGHIARGALQAWRLMGRSRPDVVLVTGGYACIPVALAARLRRVPVVVFLPDVVPGHAVRLVAAMSNRIAAASARSLPFLPAGKAVATGYPVRAAVRAADRRSARRHFGIADDAPTLLVFGGSRGARRINEALLSAAPELPQTTEILHVSGRLDFESVFQASRAFPPALAVRYRVFPFLDTEDMSRVLAAADLVVSRAGAAVMGEYPSRGLPSILVPLTIAHGHQSANAAVLAEAGAARVIEDTDLTAGTLAEAVTSILHDPARLADMSAAARRVDRPDAASRIWQLMIGSARLVPAGSAQ